MGYSFFSRVEEEPINDSVNAFEPGISAQYGVRIPQGPARTYVGVFDWLVSYAIYDKSDLN